MSARAVPAEVLSAEHRETLGRVLADAIDYRDLRAGMYCADCEACPGGACDDHAADMILAGAYRELAGELGIEVPA
jgi:hypothetical protein